MELPQLKGPSCASSSSGWLLGPIGLFLSVPLTMALMVAFNGSPHTRAIAIMLGSDIAPAELSDGKRYRARW